MTLAAYQNHPGSFKTDVQTLVPEFEAVGLECALSFRIFNHKLMCSQG